MKNIVVLYGGQSTEHEVSLVSAANIINGLDREKYRVHCVYIDLEGRFVPLGPMDHVDAPENLTRVSKLSRLESIEAFCAYIKGLHDILVIPCIHGQTGEDGKIQGFLEMLGLPYIGSRVMASALCMDKGYACQIFRDAGIPHADFLVITKAEYEDLGYAHWRQAIKSRLGFPCVVKPANNGSSVGITGAEEKTLRGALEEAFRYDRRVIVEEKIPNRELEISVLGNDHPRASLPAYCHFQGDIFDYDTKYKDTTLTVDLPYPLSEEQNQKVQQLALDAYQACGCSGYARVDIFMTPEGEFLVNEINTIPGMTPTSTISTLWTQLTDMTFQDYLDCLIQLAEDKDHMDKAIAFRRQA